MDELIKVQTIKKELTSDTFKLYFRNQLLKRNLRKLEREKKKFEFDNFILKLKLLTN